MARDKNLTININAQTKNLEKGLNKAQKQTERLQKNLASLTKKAAIGFAAVAAAVTATTLSFAKFQKDFTKVVTLLDKSSFATKSLKEGIIDLEKGVLNLRAATGESFEDLNQGLFDIISTGTSAEEAMNLLAIATNLAAAGNTNVAVAVKAVTGSLNAFGLEASEAERVSQLFFLAQKNGATTVEEITNSIGVAASSADAYGLSLEELLAATAAVTLSSKSTSQALTGLNQVFANISKPTKEAVDEAKRLGIEFNTTALRAKGLEGFLNDLTTAEGFTSQSIEKLFGSVEAQGVAFALTGKQNKAFIDTLRQLQDEALLAETFNNALAAANSTVDKSLKKLGGSLQAVNVALGKEFAPLIIAISESLTNFAKFILNADSGILKATKNVILFIGVITGLTTVLGTLGIAIIALRTGVKALGIQALLTSKAMTALGVASAGAWKKILLPVAAGITAYTAFNALIKKTGEFFGISAETSEKSLKRIKDQVLDLRDTEQKLQDKIKNGFAFRKEANIAKLADIQKEIAQSEALQSVIQKEVDLRNEVSIAKSTPLAAQDEEEKDISEIGMEAAVSTERTDAIINEKKRETELKIAEAQREIEVLKQIREGADDEEIQATRDKNALLAEEDKIKLENELLNAELKTIGGNEERQKQIEKDLELNEIELENIAAHREILNEEAEENRQAELEADDLIRTIEKEQQVEFNEIELELLRAQILGKKQITDKFLLDRLAQQSKADKRFLDMQRKFGTTFAKADKVFNNDKLSSARQTSGDLENLSRSSNKTLAAIGKAAALVNIGIDTARGAIAAYSSLAPIPIVGPVLGAAAAAALIAFGLQQASAVQASGAQKGGFVSRGTPGVDDQPFLLSRGESVIPADITPTLFDTFRQLRDIRERGGILNTIAGSPGLQPQIETKIVNEAQSLVKEFEEGEPQEINVIIDLEDEATDLITARQRENTELSIGVI